VIRAAGYSGAVGQSRVANVDDLGPWFFPIGLAGALVLGVGGLAARSWLRRSREAPADRPPEQLARGQLPVVLLFAGIVLYVGLLPWLGYGVATFLFATLLMVWLGMRGWRAAAASLAMLGIVYVLFVWQFRVILP